jgi:hypothetical protein
MIKQAFVRLRSCFMVFSGKPGGCHLENRHEIWWIAIWVERWIERGDLAGSPG